MAGRILPIALAAFAGVAIGVSTFGQEFKEQQRRRLQQEYNRDVAAATGASALPSDGPSPMASSTIPAPQQEQLPTPTEPTNRSKLSSMLGFWAWSSKGNLTKEQPPAKTNNDGPKQQP